MTDREMLQSLKSMIDAQLGTNVIPVVPVVPPAVVPVTTPDTPPAAPAGSVVANNAGNAALAAYAASGDVRGGNAGGNVTDQLQSDAAAAAEVEHRSPAFDPASPNSVRYFDGDAGASVTKRYTATQSGTLEVNIGERPGNEAGAVDFSMSGPGVSVSWRGCHLSFNDKVPGIQAGASYDLMITAAAKFATDVRAAVTP